VRSGCASLPRHPEPSSSLPCADPPSQAVLARPGPSHASRGRNQIESDHPEDIGLTPTVKEVGHARRNPAEHDTDGACSEAWALFQCGPTRSCVAHPRASTLRNPSGCTSLRPSSRPHTKLRHCRRVCDVIMCACACLCLWVRVCACALCMCVCVCVCVFWFCVVVRCVPRRFVRIVVWCGLVCGGV
jgi:hypothetical protein